MNKRYFYKEAYIGNTEITLYKDGKAVDSDIVSDYELGGYIRRLENEGYTFGYPPEEVERRKQLYEDAKELYENAKNNMIIKED